MPKVKVVRSKPKQIDATKLTNDAAKSASNPKSAWKKVAKVIKPTGKKAGR